MSNEPKWHIVHQLGDDAAIYDRQKQLFNVHTDEAQRICDVLNKLEQENAELRERLKESEEMKKALMVTDDRLGNIVHNLKSTTPRTTQPATEGEQNG
jgi:hypothetical protein